MGRYWRILGMFLTFSLLTWHLGGWQLGLTNQTGSGKEEINLVFLHGIDSEPSDLELLAREVKEEIYQGGYPGEVNTFLPDHREVNGVSISQWATNLVATMLEDKFMPEGQSLRDKGGLIIVGHDMGGKAAIYAVAHMEELAEKVAGIITINTPYKRLDNYRSDVESLCRQSGGGKGVCHALAQYDISDEAATVAQRRGRYLLSLTSAEPTNASPRCDWLTQGYDLYPTLRDDGIVPLEGQALSPIAAGGKAFTWHYGSFCHTDLFEEELLAENLAEAIVNGTGLSNHWPGIMALHTAGPASYLPPNIGPLLYEDDFSSPDSGWWIFRGPSGEGWYEDGEYHLEVNKSNSSLRSCVPRNRVFSDFAVEVDVREVSLDQGAIYGLLTRFSGTFADLNYYQFSITGDGRFGFLKTVRGRQESLVPETDSSYINRGSGTNRMAIAAKGAQFSLYINGRELVTITDSSIRTGTICLLLACESAPPCHAAFDDFKVYPMD